MFSLDQQYNMNTNINMPLKRPPSYVNDSGGFLSFSKGRGGPRENILPVMKNNSSSENNTNNYTLNALKIVDNSTDSSSLSQSRNQQQSDHTTHATSATPVSPRNSNSNGTSNSYSYSYSYHPHSMATSVCSCFTRCS